MHQFKSAVASPSKPAKEKPREYAVRDVEPREQFPYNTMLYFKHNTGTFHCVRHDGQNNDCLKAYVRDVSEFSIRVYIPGWLGLQWEPRSKFYVPT